MKNQRLALNAFYNRDESLRFVQTILRPLFVPWIEQGLVSQLYYRRAFFRGHHFQLFITLGTESGNAAQSIERELAAAMREHPSAPQFALRQFSPFFLQYENNNVYAASSDHPQDIPDDEALKAPLEAVAACCGLHMLLHSDEALFWPGVAITLSDAVLNGFRLDVSSRVAVLGSFLQMFVPASCAADKASEEGLESARQLLQKTRIDFDARQDEYQEWLMPVARERISDWAVQLEACCGQVGAVCMNRMTTQATGSPASFEQVMGPILVSMFLGLLDCLLLEDSDALVTAYRLQQLYQRATVGSAV